MAEAEGKIRKMPVAERKVMRDELYGYAIDIAKGLGDARGAQLLQMLPQTKLYAMGLEGDRLAQGREVVDLQPGAVDRLKTDIDVFGS
jgi:type IV secretion system T-DNA border endonuclease VirD2